MKDKQELREAINVGIKGHLASGLVRNEDGTFALTTDILALCQSERQELEAECEGLRDCLLTRDYALDEYKKERQELIKEILGKLPTEKTIKPYDTSDTNAWMYPPYNQALTEVKKILEGI